MKIQDWSKIVLALFLKCFFVFYFLCALHPSMSMAEVQETGMITTAPWDMSLKMGGFAGTITRANTDSDESSSDESSSADVGGIPCAVAFNKDLLLNLSMMMQWQFIVDLINSQVIRQGFEGGVSYHVFGGSKLVLVPGDMAVIAHRNPYNISLVGRAGLQQYAASSKDNPSDNFSGSAFEIRAGIEYRTDISRTSAYGFELLQTIYTLPTSVERISPMITELSFFWRVMW